MPLVSTDPAAASPEWQTTAPYHPNSPGNYEMTGVSCPSTSLCVAVDEHGTASISSDPTAAYPTWRTVALASTPLASVSCGSSSECVAVGRFGTAAVLSDPGSATPTAQAASIGDHEFDLGPVACAGTDCL